MRVGVLASERVYGCAPQLHTAPLEKDHGPLAMMPEVMRANDLALRVEAGEDYPPSAAHGNAA